jgi:hypothetical protein
MKSIILCACLLVTGGSLLAQNLNIAIQQAKRASSQNDAEQNRIQQAAGGSASAPAPGAPAATPAAPADPKLQATLSNITSLKTDFAGIVSAGANPDPSQKTSLMTDLSQAAQGTKASSDSIKKVADDFLKAVAGKTKLTAAQQTKLARDVHALFNSSHLTATQQQTLLDDVQKILTDAGASLDDAVNTVTDLKTVVSETK